jgi:hypothetical protein
MPLSPTYPSTAPPPANRLDVAFHGQHPSTLLHLSSSVPFRHPSHINIKKNHLSAQPSSAQRKFRFCERYTPMRVSRRRSTTHRIQPPAEPRPAGAGCPHTGSHPQTRTAKVGPPISVLFYERPVLSAPSLPPSAASNAARVTDSPLIPGSFSWRFNRSAGA